MLLSSRPILVSSTSFDLEHKVLVSRLSSCAKKSNRRPIAPPAACRSASCSSSSITSITPLSAKMPSSRGAAASTRPARPLMVASTAARTGSLTRTTGATPKRSTVSVPCTVPRARTCAALWRAGPSTTSQPGGRRIRGWRLSLLLGLDRTQAGDIFHVLLVAFGKGVPAGSVGDEVKLLRASRTGGSLDGGTARIRDRPGRQTVDDVGVVGRRLGYLAFGQRMPERALAEDEAVNDRRIRLQLH